MRVIKRVSRYLFHKRNLCNYPNWCRNMPSKLKLHTVKYYELIKILNFLIEHGCLNLNQCVHGKMSTSYGGSVIIMKKFTLIFDIKYSLQIIFTLHFVFVSHIVIVHVLMSTVFFTNNRYSITLKGSEIWTVCFYLFFNTKLRNDECRFICLNSNLIRLYADRKNCARITNNCMNLTVWPPHTKAVCVWLLWSGHEPANKETSFNLFYVNI